MSLFKKFAKNDIVELRPVTEFDIDVFWDNAGVMIDENNNAIHISKDIRLKGSPKIGDYIVRDERTPNFTWLINEETFKEKFRALAD